jgi:hypothetical protein
MQEMTLRYKMFLLMEMAELTDDHGHVPLRIGGRTVQSILCAEKAPEQTEEPHRFKNGLLSERSVPA